MQSYSRSKLWLMREVRKKRASSHSIFVIEWARMRMRLDQRSSSNSDLLRSRDGDSKSTMIKCFNFCSRWLRKIDEKKRIKF